MHISGRQSQVNRALAAISIGSVAGFYGGGEKINISVTDNGNSGRVINILSDFHAMSILTF